MHQSQTTVDRTWHSTGFWFGDCRDTLSGTREARSRLKANHWTQPRQNLVNPSGSFADKPCSITALLSWIFKLVYPSREELLHWAFHSSSCQLSHHVCRNSLHTSQQMRPPLASKVVLCDGALHSYQVTSLTKKKKDKTIRLQTSSECWLGNFCMSSVHTLF